MEDRMMTGRQISRRQVLREFGAAGVGLGALGGVEGLLAAAASAAPRKGALKDIEHVIILMQENRSFDHYFGTLSGVRGFADKTNHGAFFQKGLDGKTHHPFRLGRQECFADITHDWGPQHQAVNGGRMNDFLRVHEQDDGAAGPETLGYYTRGDLPFYYALADAFTICDAYHCSVIGPTDPNRIMSMSATIDPGGTHGGPILKTNVSDRSDRFSWTTMPERLSAHGVSWKVYTAAHGGVLDNVLTYFTQYSPGSKLAARGLEPVYPTDFVADLQSGHLPQVSWVLASLFDSEHPQYSSAASGEVVLQQLLASLLAHPKIWAKTALFVTWDENGGFFDHVAPPVAPKGTKGEWLTVSMLPTEADGIRGPIGLGIRVPMLILSPFSRGGLVCSETFDHTSTLRFLETRFGVEVPNLSAWRRRHTGDLTGAFNFAARPNTARPRLPHVNPVGQCTTAPPATVPVQPFPKQEKGRRRRPSGIVR